MKTLTFAAVIAATALRAETTEELLRALKGEGVSGIHDTTANMMGVWGDRAPSTACRLPGQSRWSWSTSGQVFHRLCDAVETRDWNERFARSVRERLGDPGRH
jgi:hypothetical protein